ncbi:DnaJ and TPR domain-containing protein [Gaeumannomyces tritici R3-111a-1]|uniref:Tetratricopeptide repeat and J domain-containing co-chaperone DNJ1 n=1 Tax=Gaeumannomyces tritici (strain R3-111a-1) TaxID=644352 RepID=J3NVA6_GAET3|nr:DnaJ and TPR domain-containing protein [Gaeumannomyces tritici R3-111a-1]EJT75282.1 DnaJ and TPR domain-containing protein [Gaeumannomyces tritici R3-111a-1]
MLVRLSTVALAAGVLTSSSWLGAVAISAEDIASDTPLSQLLTSAQSHLSRGETSDALIYYDAAIARNPSDYLTYFKRATTYLSLGRTAQATDDFNRVLDLKPGFEGAHVQLGRIRQRSADWAGAREQFELARKTKGHPEMDDLLEAQAAAGLAADADKAGKWDECVQNAGVAIMVANRAAALREMRARCRFEKGEVEEGMSDLQHVLNMRAGDVGPYVKISANAFYALGDLTNGLAQIRKCLHSDPESKPCKKLLRREKTIEKALAKVEKAFSKNQPMTGTRLLVPSSDDEGLIKEVKDAVSELREDGTIPKAAPNVLVARVVELACQGYYDMSSKKAQAFCDESLQLNPDSVYGLLHKAKLQQEKELYEEAIKTLDRARELAPERGEMIDKLLNDAKIALKRSQTKDYYKVLGVAHDADERQIKSAYRKLSKQHHPDKAAKQGLSKDDAEKKMATINEAYEVLSNPELRARFDAGDDPNSQQQHGGGNPFGGHPFFHQGGGGGQQFKFQFGSGGGGGFGGFPF